MNATSRNTLEKILNFAALVEVGTGLVLAMDPAIVVKLLLGAEVSHAGAVLGRCFGMALLALGLACWSRRQRYESDFAALRAMLTYNAMIALYLTYVGTVEQLWGWLLWPAVALHAVLALLLIWGWRDEPRAKTSNN